MPSSYALPLMPCSTTKPLNPDCPPSSDLLVQHLNSATMQEGGKAATALAATFALGVVAGWLLNTYTRKSLESLLGKLQDRVKKI